MIKTEFISVLDDYVGTNLSYKEYLQTHKDKKIYHYSNDLNDIFRQVEHYNKGGDFKCKVMRAADYQI